MHTAFLGTDYKRTPLKILETVYLDQDKIKEFWKSLPEDSPVEELVVVSTCNRVEIYFTCEDPVATDVWLRDYLKYYFGLGKALEMYFVSAHCHDAVGHLFNVASGLESMVFGENEILTQIKESYHFCQMIGSTGSFLNKLFQTAIAVGKRVREETNIARGAYSVSSLAVDDIVESDPDYARKAVLCVGAGVMSVRAIRKLKAIGHRRVFLTNRSQKRLIEVASNEDVHPYDYDEFRRQLAEFDFVIAATNAHGTLITLEDIEGLDFGKTIRVIDLGVPRNVDSKIGNHPNIELVTIEALKEIAERNVDARKMEKGKVMAIVDDELNEFKKWYDYKQCLVQSA